MACCSCSKRTKLGPYSQVTARFNLIFCTLKFFPLFLSPFYPKEAQNWDTSNLRWTVLFYSHLQPVLFDLRAGKSHETCVILKVHFQRYRPVRFLIFELKYSIVWWMPIDCTRYCTFWHNNTTFLCLRIIGFRGRKTYRTNCYTIFGQSKLDSHIG